MPRKQTEPMLPRVRRALRKSIAHWKRMRDGKNKDRESPDSSSCALCLNYGTAFGCLDKDGDVCPLRRKFGVCGYFNEKNPYWVAYNSWFKWNDRTGEGLSAWIPAANRMIKALESLLPKKRKARRQS
jgi:hypothetical protein